MSRLSRFPKPVTALTMILGAILLAAACSGSGGTNVAAAPTTDQITPSPEPSVADSATPNAVSPTVSETATLTPEADEPSDSPGPIEVPITATAPPPTPVPPPGDPVPCRADRTMDASFDVVNVEADDPDGGLVVHTDPGVDTPVVGVLRWYARDIVYNGRCEILPSGSEWWQVWSPEAFGWVNAAYLGQRALPIDSLDVTPCSDEDGTDLDPPVAGGSSQSQGSTLVVSDIRVESTAACDRVVIELASDWDFSTTPRPMDAFPVDAVTAIFHSTQEMQLELNAAFATAFDSIPPVTGWRDTATNEQNVALVVDRDDHSEVHIGWGTGTAAIRFAASPARIIVDIVQAPSPNDVVRGPIVSGQRFGPLLFAPITETPGIAVDGPITVRGWSRGFEASSAFDIRPWDGTAAAHPGTWNGVLFGGPSIFNSAPRPDLTFEPALPSFGGGAAVFPFQTSGYFEYVIDGFEAGPWQLAIESSGGIDCVPAAGQQFWIAGNDDMFDELVAAGADLVAGETFGITSDLSADNENISQTTVTVRGIEYTTLGDCY